MTVIRCSVGGPSECRDASASLTFGTDFSGLRTRIDVLFAVLQQGQCACCSVSNRLLIRVRVLEKSVPKVVDTEKRYVRTGYKDGHTHPLSSSCWREVAEDGYLLLSTR